MHFGWPDRLFQRLGRWSKPDGTAAPARNQLTSANGLLLLDSDYYGSDAKYDANWIENSWVQTAAPIDLEIYPYVAISF